MTLFSALLSAITWPGAILGLANIIDNPWSVCCRRSAQVGKQLAEVLLAREQGQRPVTLVGFSIGARVIYYCLRVRSLLTFSYLDMSNLSVWLVLIL